MSPKRVLALLLFVGVALVVDACFVEPNDVVLVAETWKTKVARPLVVAHVSDLHSHGFGLRERRAIAIIDAHHPDLVVVSGDVVDTGDLEPARTFFEKLHPPLGVIVVRGNWEHWSPVSGEAAFYASVNAKLLVGDGLLVRDDVYAVGLDDPGTVQPNLAKALAGKPPAALALAVFHSPAFFDRGSEQLDVAFAGHTHGGQIRVPLLAPLFLPPGSGRFVEGTYTVGTSRMHVSRGLGTSTIDARFACKPEVAIVTLVP